MYFDDFKVTHTKSPVVQSDDYYPFGLRTSNSYARENSVPNKTKLFQGQEHIDDLGLNWDSFKWRNYQPEIGRFFNVDPLAEKYVHNSTYAFAENKVITFRELEGLEGIHYMEGNNHVVEKNVVVLLREQKAIPKDADAKTVKKIERQNARIGRENAARVASVSSELNQFFSGAQNSKGESVSFKFNVTGLAVKDTKGGSDAQLKQISIANGVSGAPKFPGGPDQIAPATVVTTQSAATGENNQFFTKVGSSAPEGTLSHEVGHTLMIRMNEENQAGTAGLMGYPPSVITSTEVDKILQDSIERKKQ